MSLGVRWTVGDVSARGFEALRLSVLGAAKAFGPDAAYTVCVNTVPVAAVRARTGNLPVTWHSVGPDDLASLRPYLDAGLAEGVAWKLAPFRLFPNSYELAFDNDCIVWSEPPTVAAWRHTGRCLLAADAAPAFGRFASICGPEPRNSGIRGLPPGYDLGAALTRVLAAHPGPLATELDEQGLQVAALSDAMVVPIEDVSISSPFPPHSNGMGLCGAHFVGLNVHRERPYCDAATMAAIAAFWDARVGSVERQVHLDRPGAVAG